MCVFILSIKVGDRRNENVLLFRRSLKFIRGLGMGFMLGLIRGIIKILSWLLEKVVNFLFLEVVK